MLVADDRLAVDKAGSRFESVDRLHDGGIPLRPIMPVAGEQADSNGVAPRHEPITVVLDLVDPIGPGGWAIGGGWQAGLDKLGRHVGGN
jgi:hypothetical protein